MATQHTSQCGVKASGRRCAKPATISRAQLAALTALNGAGFYKAIEHVRAAT